MSDDTKHNPLFVKKSEAKKATVWNDLAQERIHKQHPGGIHEGDQHAVPQYHAPNLGTSMNEEETKEVVTNLEEKIKTLKEQQAPPPKPPEPTTPNPNDDWYD